MNFNKLTHEQEDKFYRDNAATPESYERMKLCNRQLHEVLDKYNDSPDELFKCAVIHFCALISAIGKGYDCNAEQFKELAEACVEDVKNALIKRAEDWDLTGE